MGRHRNDPQGLARIAIIVVAVAVVIGLIAVGGSALVRSMNSESAAPGATASPQEQPAQVLTKGESQQPYAKLEVVGQSVKVYAAEPGNSEVIWNGLFNRGDIRNISWKDLDLTISDASAVRITVKGKRFQLPAKGNISIRFVGGVPELVE
ncbi:hypothetical protein [Actinocorallia populi]|uniref:hypothetical protein n=1 Tax=Actinocorallia populi TaxID=2079200 RepID=UPI0013005FBB|nr:hypothetical protein [Actinocorallia populi]